MTSTVTTTLSSSEMSFLVRGSLFQVGVLACSDVSCRNSITVPLCELKTTVATNNLFFTLDTSYVQRAQVFFFENTIFLNCTFADNIAGIGCAFGFQDRSVFIFLPSTGSQSIGSQQCNSTTNQINSNSAISVFDLESNGTVMVPVAVPVQVIVVGNEETFTDVTECRVQRGGELLG